jgi:hypothetical protein
MKYLFCMKPLCFHHCNILQFLSGMSLKISLLKVSEKEFLINRTICLSGLYKDRSTCVTWRTIGLGTFSVIIFIPFLAHLSQSDRVSFCDRFSSGVHRPSVRKLLL